MGTMQLDEEMKRDLDDSGCVQDGELSPPLYACSRVKEYLISLVDASTYARVASKND